MIEAIRVGEDLGFPKDPAVLDMRTALGTIYMSSGRPRLAEAPLTIAYADLKTIAGATNLSTLQAGMLLGAAYISLENLEAATGF